MSQDATSSKMQVMKALYEWMGQFFSLSKIVFRKKPQLMETFGVVVRS